MNIRPIINSTLNKVSNSKFFEKLIPERAGDAAATIAIISTTTKDLVNCIYYTKQSLENKKIPEEKRKFVAGIDLSNGIMNVTTQLLLGNYVKDNAEKVYKFLFGKYIPADPTMRKLASGGFSLLLVLAFTQVFLKRVVTPFCATPMAHYFKEFAEKREAKQKEQETPNTQAQPLEPAESLKATVDVQA